MGWRCKWICSSLWSPELNTPHELSTEHKESPEPVNKCWLPIVKGRKLSLNPILFCHLHYIPLLSLYALQKPNGKTSNPKGWMFASAFPTCTSNDTFFPLSPNLCITMPFIWFGWYLSGILSLLGRSKGWLDQREDLDKNIKFVGWEMDI